MAAKDTARLSRKFQISIPKSIRAARSWQAGQIFAFIPKGEGMLLVPVPALETSPTWRATRHRAAKVPATIGIAPAGLDAAGRHVSVD